MEVKNRKLSSITAYGKNAKKHDKTQINNVAESIKQYGFVQPIVIDRDGVIVIGHCRALAAKKLGMEEVPCVCVDDLTPEQVNALRLVDNKSNESDWDFDLLADELPGLDLSAFDFDWGLRDELDTSVVEDNYRGACKDAMLRVRQCLIWVKNSLVMGRQDFQWKHEPCLYGESEIEEEAHEPCLYGWTEGKKHYFFKNRRQTTVLNFDKPVKSAEHPTMKPIKLFDYQMQCSSKPGENVLDLFAGSGTTIMAAEQNGRHAFCMEYDPKYADVIVDRWEKFTGKKAVLLNDD